MIYDVDDGDDGDDDDDDGDAGDDDDDDDGLADADANANADAGLCIEAHQSFPEGNHTDRRPSQSHRIWFCRLIGPGIC